MKFLDYWIVCIFLNMFSIGIHLIKSITMQSKSELFLDYWEPIIQNLYFNKNWIRPTYLFERNFGLLDCSWIVLWIVVMYWYIDSYPLKTLNNPKIQKKSTFQKNLRWTHLEIIDLYGYILPFKKAMSQIRIKCNA